MGLEAQGSIPASAFNVTSNLDGWPSTLKCRSVSEIVVNFPRTNASSMQSRAGAENFQTFDPGQAVYESVTFTFYGPVDDMKAFYATFDKCAKGDLLRGSVTVTLINPKEADKVIVTIDLNECTLARYAPFSGSDVDNAPGTMSCVVELIPGYLKITT